MYTRSRNVSSKLTIKIGLRRFQELTFSFREHSEKLLCLKLTKVNTHKIMSINDVIVRTCKLCPRKVSTFLRWEATLWSHNPQNFASNGHHCFGFKNCDRSDNGSHLLMINLIVSHELYLFSVENKPVVFPFKTSGSTEPSEELSNTPYENLNLCRTRNEISYSLHRPTLVSRCSEILTYSVFLIVKRTTGTFYPSQN